jgi:hypothetical protein
MLQSSPLTRISSQDLYEEDNLIGVANSRTHPNYAKAKSRWCDRRKSSLSQVAFSSVWLLHCTLKNFLVLHRVAWSFWSKILTGCLGYVEWCHLIQHPRVPLYTSLVVTHGRYRAPLPMMVAVPTCMLRSHISQGWETVQSNEVLLFPSFWMFTCP